ncbi:MAG: FecR domain-containing protein [Melioribacteraceae bacterium]|nr:FecR domain-containing protein [Melioribacteraceae bacterium]WKZ69186.1 MAG: FecR domain-containing protein [Melioribacteraceae bacterium]
MTRDDVRNLMHDYFDGLLSLDEKDTIESYLEEYEDLAAEYELLNKLIKKAQSLPIGIKTPQTVLSKISDELLSQSLEKIKSDKQKKIREITEQTESEGEKRKRLKLDSGISAKSVDRDLVNTFEKKSLPKKPLIAILAVILIVGGYFIYDFFNTNLPWNLKLNYGNYSIVPTSSASTIDNNQIITTEDSTKVSINIPNAGRVDLRSFSSLKVLKGKDSENIISLTSGRLDAVCKIDDPRLTIITPQAELKIITGNFTASINNVSFLNLETANGILKVSNSKEEITLVQDHKCTISSDGTIGIPYHIAADSSLISLVDKISFGTPSIADFGKVLNIAQPLDGMTLLYLIPKAKTPADRIPIYQKLNEFYPVVPGITQEGIIKLDKKMLELWHNEIEWQI